MISVLEAENELNGRNYFLSQATLPPPTVTLPPPVVTLPPLSPSEGEGIIDKYGKLILIGVALLFMVAIYPEGGKQPQGGGA